MLPFLVHAAAAAGPPSGAWFTYELAQDVRGTGGEYVGYRDRTRSTGRYELTTSADGIAVRARYDWTFASDDGKSERGTEDRAVTVALPDRRYTSPIDLDDEALASADPGQLAAWFWIDPGTADGAAVRVLDMDCVRLPGLSPVPGRDGLTGVLVDCTGEGDRDDDYGRFRFDFHERYWYDAVTGLVLATRYTETDRGTFEGRQAAFSLEEGLDLTGASYVAVTRTPARSEPSDETALAAALLGQLCVFAGVVVAGGAFLVWLVRAVARNQAPPEQVRGAFGETALARVADPLALTAYEPACTTHFGPFLEDFVRKALAAGDPVAVATAGGKLVGLAWNDREASVATVLTSDTATANGLLRWIEGKDFFSEHRHRRHDGEPWFNVHETYVVLALDAVADVPYDTGLVGRMTDGERPAVEALCAAVFEVGASRWLGTQLDQGDLAYVARVDGKVVGFALATACGDHGRLHTLAVDPAHRDRGIGGELVRARLTALARLGVRRALVEIASWNVASLHLARQAGFVDAGELFVETTSRARAKRTIVRR